MAVYGSVVHVIWQNTSDGTVKYLRGNLDGTSGLQTPFDRDVSARLLRQGADLVTLEGASPNSSYRILASHGGTLHQGTCDAAGRATLPNRFITPDKALLVQVQSLMGPTLLKLGLQP